MILGTNKKHQFSHHLKGLALLHSQVLKHYLYLFINQVTHTLSTAVYSTLHSIFNVCSKTDLQVSFYIHLKRGQIFKLINLILPVKS